VKTSLTKKEFWFLRTVYSERAYEYPLRTSEVANYLGEYDDWEFSPDYCISELGKEDVLSISPDGHSFKITDLGIELLEATLRLEEEWQKPGVVRVLKRTKNQTLIPAGHHFTGQRLARVMLSEATESLDILDPYIGAELFDRIDDAGINVSIRILTSPKAKFSPSYFNAFKERYSTITLKVLQEEKLHDRFILIDKTNGYHLGHSIKDLGKKDTQISPIENIQALLSLFEQR
jgi:hypothetical protein